MLLDAVNVLGCFVFPSFLISKDWTFFLVFMMVRSGSGVGTVSPDEELRMDFRRREAC